MGRIDEEQVVFKQLTLSDFKKWSPTASKALSSLIQFLETEIPLKRTKNDFYFTISRHFILALLVLKIFKIFVVTSWSWRKTN